jgi:hypothetical protein
MGKGRNDAAERQSPAHDGVLGDRAQVVKVHEPKPNAPAKDQQNREEQEDADRGGSAA